MLSLLKRASVTAAVVTAGFASSLMADVRLQGSGATFPNPLYQKWVTEYQKSHPDVKIDYQSIGSGGGIQAITQKTVDFAGSDAPLKKKEEEAMGGNAVHIPTTAGAVVLAYNLPSLSGELVLSGEVVADIYMGKITKWNDGKIAALNSGASLPDAAITPVYRTDGSGTTSIFTSYLATQAPDFKSTVGVGKQVNFPAGQGGKGNEGVTAAVKQSQGTIGYVELNYATANKIPFASIKNQSGKAVKPSLESVAAAGKGAVDKMTPEKLAVDIWNQPGDEAYPISSFTYIVVYKDLSNVKSAEQKKALVDFLNWAVTDGQKLSAELDYAPLDPAVQEKAKAAIAMLKQ
jgi:phosphate transport system substrate-binding protein